MTLLCSLSTVMHRKTVLDASFSSTDNTELETFKAEGVVKDSEGTLMEGELVFGYQETHIAGHIVMTITKP